jgi:hypothetical protein
LPRPSIRGTPSGWPTLGECRLAPRYPHKLCVLFKHTSSVASTNPHLGGRAFVGRQGAPSVVTMTPQRSHACAAVVCLLSALLPRAVHGQVCPIGQFVYHPAGGGAVQCVATCSGLRYNSSVDCYDCVSLVVCVQPVCEITCICLWRAPTLFAFTASQLVMHEQHVFTTCQPRSSSSSCSKY